jgi:hypothetical protein
MKLENLIPRRHRSEVVRQFGDAQLIRRPNGRHELIGGTDADRIDAIEWVSLFAHEIVFTHFHRKGGAGCPSRQHRFSSRLLPAM